MSVDITSVPDIWLKTYGGVKHAPLVIEQPEPMTAQELYDMAIDCQKEIDNNYWHELEFAKIKREWQNKKLMAQYRHALLGDDKDLIEHLKRYEHTHAGRDDVSNIGWVQDQVPHDVIHCDICDNSINGMMYEHIGKKWAEVTKENEELYKVIEGLKGKQ